MKMMMIGATEDRTVGKIVQGNVHNVVHSLSGSVRSSHYLREG